jgi:hypothetical protein
MSTLAEALRTQHEYKATEAIHRQTLATREKVLRKEHPDELKSMITARTKPLGGDGSDVQAEARDVGENTWKGSSTRCLPCIASLISCVRWVQRHSGGGSYDYASSSPILL